MEVSGALPTHLLSYPPSFASSATRPRPLSLTPKPGSRPHFRVSPAVLGPLGLEQLQDPALAVLELIKNAWDADATRVTVGIDRRSGRITVTDNGHGMTEAEFNQRWLVIGSSYKRNVARTNGGRPLIGEKGLGRLASFALGNVVTITSAQQNRRGFKARVDWDELMAADSLEDYAIYMSGASASEGTTVLVDELKTNWTPEHTEFLVSHTEFLASVPGQRFRVSLVVDGKNHPIQEYESTLDRLAEGSFEMLIKKDGEPQVTKCVVKGKDEGWIAFRRMKPEEMDQRLSGVRISFRFFRRDVAARRLAGHLEKNEVVTALERYQGIRVYRDGINVPPYGLNGDDWAALEKQRTATGGPTLVPGNSQLVGEVNVQKAKHPHFVITAGRSGFTDQASVTSLANYVRWAVRAFATARRAEHLGISDGTAIPGRVDDTKSTPPSEAEDPAKALAAISRSTEVRSNPALRRQVEAASQAVSQTLDRADETLRLYAQLASTGIAATSFAHELRADFDVVSETVGELSRRKKPDRQVIDLLAASWSRIRSFAALFKVIPVKLRRHRRTMAGHDLRSSAETILGLAPPDRIATEVDVDVGKAQVVQAEIDSLLLNLVSNAIKAINESPRRNDGRIRVSLSAQGSDLLIKVADNGVGVKPNVAAIMFEPLEGSFSEGTGMGLPITRYIAERYDGVVQLGKPLSPFATEFVVRLRKVILE